MHENKELTYILSWVVPIAKTSAPVKTVAKGKKGGYVRPDPTPEVSEELHPFVAISSNERYLF